MVNNYEYINIASVYAAAVVCTAWVKYKACRTLLCQL